MTLLEQISDFKRVPTTLEKVLYLLGALSFCYLWTLAVLFLYQVFEMQASYSFTVGQFFVSRAPGILEVVFTTCILAPLWEEICFRKAPIDIGKSLKLNKTALASLVLAMSSIFALGHPLGILSIPLQGVFGMLAAWLYLKNRNILWSIAFHSLWNSFILFKVIL